MKMRTAIFAACAGTLALAQTDMARANGTAAEPKSLVRVAAVGPKPMMVAGAKITENESPRPQNRAKAPRKGNAPAAIGFEKTFLDGNASFGLRLPGRGGTTGR